MIGKVDINFVSKHDCAEFKNCGINRGPLKLPDGMSVEGDLIAFGENDLYLHCIIGKTGDYYGVFKSDDENHLYQRLIALNT